MKKFIVLFLLITVLFVPTQRGESFVLTATLGAMTTSQAVASALFTAGAYICWQNANRELWQDLNYEDTSGNDLSRSTIEDAIVANENLQTDSLPQSIIDNQSDFYWDGQGFKFSSLNKDIHNYSWPKHNHWSMHPTDGYWGAIYVIYRGDDGGDDDEYWKMIWNKDTIDSDSPDVANIPLEDRYPNILGDDYIVASAIEAINNNSSLGSQVDAQKISSPPTDAYQSYPDGRPNTTDIAVAGVSDKNASSGGYIITPSGEKITVSQATKTDINSEIDPPIIDSTSQSDAVIDDADEGTPPVSIPQSLKDKLDNAGVNGDVTGISGNQVRWKDSSGQEHITSVDPDTTKDLVNAVPDSIMDNWQQSGTVQGDVVSGAQSVTVEVEGSIPDVPTTAPGFDTSVNLPEKQNIPMSDWISAIPFLGLLDSSGVQYESSQSVFTMDFNIAGVDYNNTVDFAQWSGIFEMMGTIIFAVASFVAIRISLIS